MEHNTVRIPAGGASIGGKKFKIEIDYSIWREEIQNRNRLVNLAGRKVRQHHSHGRSRAFQFYFYSVAIRYDYDSTTPTLYYSRRTLLLPKNYI